MFPRVFLKNREEIEVAQGFPWVFDNEIDHVKFEEKSGVKQTSLEDCSVKDGEVVDKTNDHCMDALRYLVHTDR